MQTLCICLENQHKELLRIQICLRGTTSNTQVLLHYNQSHISGNRGRPIDLNQQHNQGLCLHLVHKSLSSRKHQCLWSLGDNQESKYSIPHCGNQDGIVDTISSHSFRIHRLGYRSCICLPARAHTQHLDHMRQASYSMHRRRGTLAGMIASIPDRFSSNLNMCY